MNEAVILEQTALFTPFGDLAQTLDALMRGECAIRPGPCFEVPTAYAPFTDERLRDIRYCAHQLAVPLDLSRIDQAATVLIGCCAKGDIHSLEDVVSGTTQKADTSPLLDLQTRRAAEAIGLTPSQTLSISNACASGAIALEVAKEMLEDGRCAHAVLFGIESLCRFVATGFNALSALSPDGARPFDAKRNGLSLGETAVVAVVSRRKAAAGNTIIAGAGSSNDANHRTGPSRTGDGLYRAARAALSDASVEPDAIGAVKCHGTATPYNDAMEAKAVNRLFGDDCPPCVSFKGAFGHTSGAGSLMETVVAAECLKRRMLPPTVRYDEHGVDERIAVSSITQAIEKPTVLCLSAGFGGVNAGIVVSEACA